MGRDRAMVESEIAMLDEMLASIERGRVIERVGLEARAEALRSELAALEDELPRVVLTFRGEPVVGARSILAEFGGKAAALFSEAVATVSASLSTELGNAGPLPQGADRQLRIVGTAIGSFGFELELPPRETLPGLPLPEMRDAVESTLALIQSAEAGDEDALSELIAEIHPRAAAKVRAFVKHVVDRNAGFAVRFGDHRAAVPDAQEGRAVLEALREDQITQRELSIEGALSGVLPDARRFEARASDGALLSGRIDRSAGDPEELLTTWRGRTAQLEVRETRVRAARPSYVLLAIQASSSS